MNNVILRISVNNKTATARFVDVSRSQPRKLTPEQKFARAVKQIAANLRDTTKPDFGIINYNGIPTAVVPYANGYLSNANGQRWTLALDQYEPSEYAEVKRQIADAIDDGEFDELIERAHKAQLEAASKRAPALAKRKQLKQAA